jgi:hypothetical protein
MKDGNEAPRVASDVLSGGPGIVDGLAPEWRQLCDASDDPLPFTRPEWVGAYFRSNDKARRFLILTVRLNGKLKAVLPLIDRRAGSPTFPPTCCGGRRIPVSGRLTYWRPMKPFARPLRGSSGEWSGA